MDQDNPLMWLIEALLGSGGGAGQGASPIDPATRPQPMPEMGAAPASMPSPDMPDMSMLSSMPGAGGATGPAMAPPPGKQEPMSEVGGWGGDMGSLVDELFRQQWQRGLPAGQSVTPISGASRPM